MQKRLLDKMKTMHEWKVQKVDEHWWKISNAFTYSLQS